MKKLIYLFIILLLLSLLIFSEEKISQVENEIKGILKQVSPAMLKVVAENAKKYIATGIALDEDVVITTSQISHRPYQKIYVITVKGDSFPASEVGRDDQTGIMLLKLNKKILQPVVLASNINTGDWIALVGAFYKSFPSIFQGIVSNVDEDELILNAPVLPGAAGGAVVNKKGELVGVIRGVLGVVFSPEYTFRDHSTEILIRSKDSSGDHLCYALPVNKVVKITSELKKYGRVRRGWLGIYLSGDQLTTITRINEKSPAALAGLKPFDRIEEIDGRPMQSITDITQLTENLLPGQMVKIKVRRNDKSLLLAVKIGEKEGLKNVYVDQWVPKSLESEDISSDSFIPTPSFPQVESFVIDFSGSRQLGIEVMELTGDLAEKYGIRERYGMVIAKVNKGSAAEKGKLNVGDILIRANDIELKNVSDLRIALDKLKDKESIQFDIYRSGKILKVSIIPDLTPTWDGKFDKLQDQLRKYSRNLAEYMEQSSEAIDMAKEKWQNPQGIVKNPLKQKLSSQLMLLQKTLEQLKIESREISQETKDKYIDEIQELQRAIDKFKKRMAEELKNELD